MICIQSDRLDVSLRDNTTTVVFGPSGIGKSTLLKQVAGHLPLKGTLQFAEEDIEGNNQAVEADNRNFSYIAQRLNLIETFTVQQNLDLAVRFSSYQDSNALAQQMIALVEIEPLLHKQTNRLSGGEYQLVSFCMGMISGSRWLLFDEPLSAVDKARKHRVLTRFKRWQRTNKVPVLYVTHDVNEMALIADDVLLMSEATTKVMPYQQLIDAVDSEFITQYANENIIETEWQASEGGIQCLTIVNTDLSIYALGEQPNQTLQWLTIPMVDISISLEPMSHSSILNQLPAVVNKIGAQREGTCFVSASVGEQRFTVRITNKSRDELNLDVGRKCYICFKAPKLFET